MQDIQENQEDFSEAVPLQKVKKERVAKPRTEKQLEHFKKMAEKRKENIEKKKLEKKIEASKLLLQHEVNNAVPAAPQEAIRKKKSPPPNEQSDEDISISSGSSAEKIIVNVKNKNKKKKKPKQIIIYKDDSESDEESDVDDRHTHPKYSSFGKTQQNKKTKTKIHTGNEHSTSSHKTHVQQNSATDFKNYFAE
jgi:hypothetical protein